MRKYILFLFLLLANFLTAQTSNLVGVKVTRVKPINWSTSFSITFSKFNESSSSLNQIGNLLPIKSLSSKSKAFDHNTQTLYFPVQTNQGFEVVALNTISGSLTTIFKNPNFQELIESIVLNEKTQELYIFKLKLGINNPNAFFTKSLIKLNLYTKVITSFGNIIIEGDASNAIINTRTNRIILVSNYTSKPHLTSINGTTGAIVERKLIQLPYSCKGLKNLVLDEETNTIYCLAVLQTYASAIPQRHTMYFAKINATSLDFTYINSAPIIGGLEYSSCTFNKNTGTYFFGDLVSISSINTLTGNLIKTDTLFRNGISTEESNFVHMVYTNNKPPTIFTNNIAPRNISIYPNPVLRNNLATVEMKDFANSTECIIYNSIGNKVHGFILNQKTKKLNLQSLKSGIYYMRVGKETIQFSVIN